VTGRAGAGAKAADGAGDGPGTITVARQQPVDVDATVRLEGEGQPPSAVWRALVDGAVDDGDRGLLAPLQAAVRELLADRDTPRPRQALLEAGVTGESGALARVLTGLDRAPTHEAHRDARETVRRLGSAERTPLGWQVGLEAVPDVLAPLAAVERQPTVVVVMERGFREQRRAQREQILELLVAVATVADVRLVATTLTERFLATEHRATLPSSVTERLDARRVEGPLAEVVETARETLDPEGRAAELLGLLADEPTETLTYGALAARLNVGRSYVRRLVTEDLQPLGLVERVDVGEAAVALHPAGNSYVETVETGIARQQRLDDCVTQTGKPVSDSRVDTRVHGAGEEAPTPPGDRGRDRHRLDRHHRTAYLSRWEHDATRAAVVEQGVALLEEPIDPQDDRGAGRWSYDDEREELVVGAEYDNPLQHMASVAMALLNWRTFEHVLTPQRLDALLEAHPATILRHGRTVGWLSGDVEDGEDLRDALQDGREQLGELTTKLAKGEYEDRNRFRGEITRLAHGLVGTMRHLLDLAGVEVTTQVRVPRFRQFDEGDRRDLARCLAIGTAIGSRYGHFTAYRQLFEDREEKREQALAPEVDAAEPLGRPLGDTVVVGPGVAGLEDELTDELEAPYPVQEDAPEFAVHVPVATADRRCNYGAVTQRLTRRKGLEPTRAAVSVLRAFTRSVWAAGRALSALSGETGRPIGLDEVRLALATLEADELLPDHPPTVQKATASLLRAKEPLSQTELAEAADVSARSLRTHLDRMEAIGVVAVTAGGYRLALPFGVGEREQVQRGVSEEMLGIVVPPWWDQLQAGLATEQSALDRVCEALLGEGYCAPENAAVYEALSWPPDPTGLVERWSWLEPWLPVIRGLVDAPSSDPALALLGEQPEQAALAVCRPRRHAPTVG
jgi:biotin operon repressor